MNNEYKFKFQNIIKSFDNDNIIGSSISHINDLNLSNVVLTLRDDHFGIVPYNLLVKGDIIAVHEEEDLPPFCKKIENIYMAKEYLKKMGSGNNSKTSFLCHNLTPYLYYKLFDFPINQILREAFLSSYNRPLPYLRRNEIFLQSLLYYALLPFLLCALIGVTCFRYNIMKNIVDANELSSALPHGSSQITKFSFLRLTTYHPILIILPMLVPSFEIFSFLANHLGNAYLFVFTSQAKTRKSNLEVEAFEEDSEIVDDDESSTDSESPLHDSSDNNNNDQGIQMRDNNDGYIIKGQKPLITKNSLGKNENAKYGKDFNFSSGNTKSSHHPLRHFKGNRGRHYYCCCFSWLHGKIRTILNIGSNLFNRMTCNNISNDAACCNHHSCSSCLINKNLGPFLHAFYDCVMGRNSSLPYNRNPLMVLSSISNVCALDKQGILSWPDPVPEKCVVFTANPQNNHLNEEDEDFISQQQQQLLPQNQQINNNSNNNYSKRLRQQQLLLKKIRLKHNYNPHFRTRGLKKRSPDSTAGTDNCNNNNNEEINNNNNNNNEIFTLRKNSKSENSNFNNNNPFAPKEVISSIDKDEGDTNRNTSFFYYGKGAGNGGFVKLNFINNSCTSNSNPNPTPQSPIPKITHDRSEKSEKFNIEMKNLTAATTNMILSPIDDTNQNKTFKRRTRTISTDNFVNEISMKVMPLTHEPNHPENLAFEDSDWKDYLNHLKPLTYAINLTVCNYLYIRDISEFYKTVRYFQMKKSHLPTTNKLSHPRCLFKLHDLIQCHGMGQNRKCKNFNLLQNYLLRFHIDDRFFFGVHDQTSVDNNCPPRAFFSVLIKDISRSDSQHRRERGIDFDGMTKKRNFYSTGGNRKDETRYQLFSCGTPDLLLQYCHDVWTGNDLKAFTSRHSQNITAGVNNVLNVSSNTPQHQHQDESSLFHKLMEFYKREYLQTRESDCLMFAYKPLLPAEAKLIKKIISAKMKVRSEMGKEKRKMLKLRKLSPPSSLSNNDIGDDEEQQQHQQFTDDGHYFKSNVCTTLCVKLPCKQEAANQAYLNKHRQLRTYHDLCFGGPPSSVHNKHAAHHFQHDEKAALLNASSLIPFPHFEGDAVGAATEVSPGPLRRHSLLESPTANHFSSIKSLNIRDFDDHHNNNVASPTKSPNKSYLNNTHHKNHHIKEGDKDRIGEEDFPTFSVKMTRRRRSNSSASTSLQSNYSSFASLPDHLTSSSSSSNTTFTSIQSRQPIKGRFTRSPSPEQMGVVVRGRYKFNRYFGMMSKPPPPSPTNRNSPRIAAHKSLFWSSCPEQINVRCNHPLPNYHEFEEYGGHHHNNVLDSSSMTKKIYSSKSKQSIRLPTNNYLSNESNSNGSPSSLLAVATVKDNLVSSHAHISKNGFKATSPFSIIDDCNDYPNRRTSQSPNIRESPLLLLPPSSPIKDAVKGGGAGGGGGLNLEDPELSYHVLFNLLCHQIALGGTSSQYPPRIEFFQIIDNLQSAFIRFVFFSRENETRSKIFAEKIGLDIGWNCSISLNEALYNSNTQSSIEGTNSILPRGIHEIRNHLSTIDNVPLLVPLFTDCPAPKYHIREQRLDSFSIPIGGDCTRLLEVEDSVLEMMKIMQANGEIVLIFGNGLSYDNFLRFAACDIAIGIKPLMPVNCYKISKSHARGPIPMNSKQPKHREKAAHAQNFANSSSKNDYYNLSFHLNTLMCSYTFEPHENFCITRIIKKARQIASNIIASCTYMIYIDFYLSLTLLVFYLVFIPFPLKPYHIVWILAFIQPTIMVSLLANPAKLKVMDMATHKNTRLKAQKIAFYGLMFVLKFLPFLAIYLAIFSSLLHNFCKHIYQIPNFESPLQYYQHHHQKIRCDIYTSYLTFDVFHQNLSEYRVIWNDWETFENEQHYNESRNVAVPLHNKQVMELRHLTDTFLSIAQSLMAFTFSFNALLMSTSFIYRFNHVWKRNPFKNPVWRLTFPILLCTQFFFTVMEIIVIFKRHHHYETSLKVIININNSFIPIKISHLIPFHFWILLIFGTFLANASFELVKRREIRQWTKEQKRIKLNFGTKLGMHSPF